MNRYKFLRKSLFTYFHICFKYNIISYKNLEQKSLI